jgi:hypothetical protein
MLSSSMFHSVELCHTLYQSLSPVVHYDRYLQSTLRGRHFEGEAIYLIPEEGNRTAP